MEIASLKALIDKVRATRFTRFDARFEGPDGPERIAFHVARVPCVPAPAAREVPPRPPEKAEPVVVRAHLVGRFYTTATASEIPPVRPGQTVKRGQRIGMIEAMNLEHVIVAPVDGKLVEACLDDGAPVEYGAPLFRIAAGGAA